jgi:hypothetical protein
MKERSSQVHKESFFLVENHGQLFRPANERYRGEAVTVAASTRDVAAALENLRSHYERIYNVQIRLAQELLTTTET